MNGIALVFHELATNAAKYGALSNNQGQVEIRWVRDGDKLRLDWVESGGPPVERPPQTSGFGGTLVKTTVAGQLGGELSYDWKPGGLAVAMTLALDKIAL